MSAEGPGPFDHPSVDVVIVTYNSEDVIEALLDSLREAFAGMSHRCVVVDNGSTDRTVELVRGLGDGTSVVEAPNFGFGAGINTGVEALAGEGPILVLNPDVRLHAGSVEPLVRALEAPDVGVAVPLLRNQDGSTARSLRREPTLSRSMGLGDSRYAVFSEVVNDPRDYERTHCVEWATGAVLMVDRACYRALDGFDETFFMYSEETDFSLRGRDLGWWTVFVPDAGATHIGGASGRSPDLYAMQVLNRIRLYRRRHALGAAALLWILTAARESVHVLRGNEDSRRALWSLVRAGSKPRLLPWAGGPLRTSRPERVSVPTPSVGRPTEREGRA